MAWMCQKVAFVEWDAWVYKILMLVLNFMRGRMCMYKLELIFSDFCKYSYISEINYLIPKRNTSKYQSSSRFVNSINFENRVISYISEHHFLNHGRETFRFQKAVPLIHFISRPLLHRWKSILCFTYVLFTLPWSRYQWNKSCKKQVYGYS